MGNRSICSSVLLGVALCVVALSVSAWASSPFVIGEEGSTPPAGMKTISLKELQTTMVSLFVSQYNEEGLLLAKGIIADNCCLRVEDGWLYSPADKQNLIPCVDGEPLCHPAPLVPMRLATEDKCFHTLTDWDVQRWTVNWDCRRDSFALWVRNGTATATPSPTPSSSSSPSMTPSPSLTPSASHSPPGAYRCCLYSARWRNYNTTLCQEYPMPCPWVSGFSDAGSTIVYSLDDCAHYWDNL